MAGGPHYAANPQLQERSLLALLPESGRLHSPIHISFIKLFFLRCPRAQPLEGVLGIPNQKKKYNLDPRNIPQTDDDLFSF